MKKVSGTSPVRSPNFLLHQSLTRSLRTIVFVSGCGSKWPPNIQCASLCVTIQINRITIRHTILYTGSLLECIRFASPLRRQEDVLCRGLPTASKWSEAIQMTLQLTPPVTPPHTHTHYRESSKQPKQTISLSITITNKTLNFHLPGVTSTEISKTVML